VETAWGTNPGESFMNAAAPLASFAEFWHNHFLRWLALAYVSIWIAPAIKPLRREDWLLEN
jgi:hypothetical protein